MRRQYKRKSTAKMSGGKKVLLTFLSILLLVALFFLSFWVTSYVLQSNHESVLPQQQDTEALATPKPTYEELEQMVMEKDAEIERLKEQLELYSEGNKTDLVTMPQPTAAATPQATTKPSPKPVQTATPAPTTAPTKTPTPAPTEKPTETPVQTPSVPLTAPGAEAPAE